MSTVDVVIPTFDARDLVLRCLQRLDDPAIAQTVVVDDASTDGTSQALPERFPDVQVVELERHRGLSYALNRGAQRGSAPFILFLNNDVFPVGNAISDLLSALRNRPLATSAGGQLVDPRTRQTQETYQPRALPGLAGIVVRLVGIERYWPRNPWTGQHLLNPLDTAGVTETDRQPAGSCLLVRRELFERIKGWDETYWFWYEDVDISRRLAEFGKALYVPAATFEHVGQASTKSWARHEQHKRLYHGTLCYAERHLPRWQQILVGLTMIVVMLPRILWLMGKPEEDALRVYRHLLGEGLALIGARTLVPATGGPRAASKRTKWPAP